MSGKALRVLVATSVVLVAVFGCSERPTPPASVAPSDSPTTAAPTPSDSQGKAVRAYVDPATGQLREPTPEEIAALAAAESESKKNTTARTKPSEPREVKLPSGAIAIQLDDSAQQPLKGCIDKSGDVKMEHDCEGNAGAKR